MNCSQIFCTFAVETTPCVVEKDAASCELLSNFLYFCSRNNRVLLRGDAIGLWIALKFFVLLQSKQPAACAAADGVGVNCSQIFCTFAVETTHLLDKQPITCCELLSNFLYFCSRNNAAGSKEMVSTVVNCSQIFCTFAVETTKAVKFRRPKVVWIALKFFVLLQSKQPIVNEMYNYSGVNCSQIFCTFAVETTCFTLIIIAEDGVNCSQIFCTFAVETTSNFACLASSSVWIALKFFVLLQSKQLVECKN